jgi:Fur family ferric uptake transcriptional regulator
VGSAKQARGMVSRDLLLDAGIRPTRQRLSVLDVLREERDDATAQELHARLRARGELIGLATVYRTIAALRERGIVDALSHRRGEACYRLCGQDRHHHHLVCVGCHRVVELSECKLGGWLNDVSAAHGFAATDHVLEVTGLCGACSAASA